MFKRVSFFVCSGLMCLMFVGPGSSLAAAQAWRPETVPVPADIEVGAGFSLFFRAHAVGTQNYMCLPSGASFAWAPIGPQATLFQTLFGSFEQQVATHFLSQNPSEGGVARATWQMSLDSSRVWAKMVRPSSDPAYVDPNAIPWLLLEKAGFEAGPSGGFFLMDTRYIQRVNTAGGKAPATGCTQATNIGATAFVPYEADYLFFKANRAR